MGRNLFPGPEKPTQPKTQSAVGRDLNQAIGDQLLPGGAWFLPCLSRVSALNIYAMPIALIRILTPGRSYSQYTGPGT